MPKFGDGNESTSFGRTVDKRNESVAFEDSSHTYWDLKTGDKYISVTQLIGQYEQPYDGEFWSRYKAIQALLSVEDWNGLKSILLNTKKWKDDYLEIYCVDKKEFEDKVQEIKDEWEAKKNESCEHGTAVHLQQELAFYKDADAVVKRYGLGGSFTCIPGYYTLNLERGIYPEILISWDFDGLRVAGQVDCLIVDNQQITIIDHKTNNEIKKESFFDKRTKKHVMMQPPLNNIQDCNYWHYTLQLSLYAYLLQCANPKYEIKALILHHIDRDGKETDIDCPYLKDEVKKMIAHYKRRAKVKAQMDMLKPIKY